MKQTGDLNLVKQMNKAIVLEHIRKHSPVSRAEIAALTGLTKATVSSLVSEWIDSHMVFEIGTGASSGGRKPVMLLFNKQAGYAIGVDLGVDYIAAALTDLEGSVVQELRIAHRNISVQSVIGDLVRCVRELISRAPVSPYGIVGIGIGIPGISDDQGTVLFAPNLGWENVPLKQLVEQELGIPVAIDNEANAGAVAEKQFGAGTSASHLIYVSLGSGIGTGIIIKGELYRGATGFSGEIGHVTIELSGPKCRCGNIGCWELYASEHALLQQAKKLLGEDGIDVETLISRAREGNTDAVQLFSRLGHYLGVGLVGIANSFNPELIIIGGRLTEAAPWLEKPMHEALEQRLLPFPRKELQVRFSSLGARSAVLGASSFAISTFLASIKA
ncbi:ROK family transcriptional regulator [Paenibacillus hamazuiensis]|uniref:ROK family transcriptional regulator n=1 Tax=Paenibacillus hamazuiensis TaxID=2936508 RepID=UPI0020100AC0|nr:ROK family transcriptional regulator [Paenibacillus hamazuiensis]